MKLWYQSMTRASAWGTYNTVLRSILDSTRDPGTEIEVHGITKTGGVADQYRYLDYLESGEVMENCHEALRRGFDAFLIGNIGDPGLALCREIADIPVLGLGETCAHLACMMGANFSFVTINEKFTARIVENIERYKLAGRLAAINRMRIERLTDLEAGFSDDAARGRIIEQFMQAANANVDHGAEVVIPAGGVVMALLAHAGVHTAGGGAPVLNGITALVKQAEAVVKLDRIMGGRFTSKRLSYAPPPIDQIEQIRQYYGDVYPTVGRK
ncbi:MAG: hypothetical protein IT531_19300 [Burkholderiales bacterium]|nr:hypothetical protein [Burkholderiales bacterium]